MSLLPIAYKNLSSILLSKLTSCVEDIIADNQCEFRRNKSTTDQIFCIHQILEYNKVVNQLFRDLEKVYTQNRTFSLNLVYV